MRVLVVDDYIDSADLQRQFLTMDGHECRVAHTGAHALSLVESWCPDLVLLDLGLPDLNGWEVASRIAALCVAPPPRIIVVSAFDPDPDMLRTTVVEQYVKKPVDLALMRSLLESAARQAGESTTPG